MNLAPRSLSPAWTCTSAGCTNDHVRDAEDTCDFAPAYSLVIGEAHVVLNLRTGVGHEWLPQQSSPRRLNPAEARLALLEWTRTRMPVPSPAALWIVEAAAIASTGCAEHWREWATADLRAALVALLDSPVQWTPFGRAVLAKATESTSVASSSVDGAALDIILRELVDFVASVTKSDDGSGPAPEVVDYCSEIEWDRVRARIDCGELGLRSRVYGTVWTASIGQKGIRVRHDAERLWARLVDDESGAVHDELEMRLVDGVWSARGYVSPAARKVATRVDVTADPNVPARAREERVQVLAEQRWFRLLHFERRSQVESSVEHWRDVYRQRLRIHLPHPRETWTDPFLAERHLRPPDLASGTARHVASTRSCHRTPAEVRRL